MLKQFFLAIQGNINSYYSFLKTLSALDDTVRTNPGSIQSDTLDSIQGTASVIEVAALGLLQIRQGLEKMDQDIKTDIAKIIEEDMSHLRISDDPNPKHATAPSTPLYVQPAHLWLLSNLHNPYPSKEVKKTISRDTKCSLKDIDAWFIDVRKRIGWNSLRKSHFGNKQERIITAAARVFNIRTTSFKDDPSTALHSEMDPNDNHRAAFLTIQRRAKALYADKFPDLMPSESFNDPTDQASISRPSNINFIKEMSQSSPSTPEEVNVNDFYPTPQPSPRCHVEESPTGVSQQVDRDLRSNTRKRRDLSEERDNHGEIIDGSLSRPSKRFRYNDNQANNLAETNISSPLHREPETVEVSSTVDAIPISQKRKRRLSDGGNQLPSKRPHNALCIPRIQTVSDPLPMTKLQSSHFFESSPPENVFGEDCFSDSIPCPVNAEDLSPSEVPLNIDLHQYDLSPYNLGIHLPEVSNNPDLENEPHAPVDSDFFPTLGSHSFARLQDDMIDYIDTSNVNFYLDPMPSYHADLQYDQNKSADDFGIFVNSELLLVTPDIASPQIGVCGSTDDLDSSPIVSVKNPILGNFNHAVSTPLPHSGEQAAKRARAQALREELARYEAEGL